MNKLLLLTLTTFLFSTQTQSQPYQPLLESVNHWSLTFDYAPMAAENSDPCQYPYYQFGTSSLIADTDTTINSFVYKKLDDINRCRLGYLREDTSARRVYFVNNSFNSEELIYDFGMQIGDSIQLNFYYQGSGNYWINGYYILDSINSVSTISGTRREFNLNCHSSSSSTLKWIEGVGNIALPVYTYGDNQFQMSSFQFSCSEFPHDKGGTFVTCYQHNQLVYFDYCAHSLATAFGPWYYDSCHYEIPPGSVGDFNFSSRVRVSTNPFHDKTKLLVNKNGEEEYVLNMYDSGARLIRSESVKGNTIEVERHNLNPGLYFFKLIDTKGKFASGKLIIQ